MYINQLDAFTEKKKDKEKKYYIVPTITLIGNDNNEFIGSFTSKKKALQSLITTSDNNKNTLHAWGGSIRKNIAKLYYTNGTWLNAWVHYQVHIKIIEESELK